MSIKNKFVRKVTIGGRRYGAADIVVQFEIRSPGENENVKQYLNSIKFKHVSL